MPICHRRTASYKENRNRSGLQEDSAGLIVPLAATNRLKDKGQHNPVQGKGPYFSERSSMQRRTSRLPYG